VLLSVGDRGLVSDFGLSRFVASDADNSTVYDAGASDGTLIVKSVDVCMNGRRVRVEVGST
jgi:hypothetical protein